MVGGKTKPATVIFRFVYVGMSYQCSHYEPTFIFENREECALGLF